MNKIGSDVISTSAAAEIRAKLDGRWERDDSVVTQVKCWRLMEVNI